jgi:threonine dehydrogenase-like Zn-dependent dehydrogenase
MKGRRTSGIGLAIVGAGRVGLFRGEMAARHPAVEWIGIAELNDNRGKSVAAKIGADFVTTDHHWCWPVRRRPAPSSRPTSISMWIPSCARSSAACPC